MSALEFLCILTIALLPVRGFNKEAVDTTTERRVVNQQLVPDDGCSDIQVQGRIQLERKLFSNPPPTYSPRMQQRRQQQQQEEEGANIDDLALTESQEKNRWITDDEESEERTEPWPAEQKLRPRKMSKRVDLAGNVVVNDACCDHEKEEEMFTVAFPRKKNSMPVGMGCGASDGSSVCRSLGSQTDALPLNPLVVQTANQEEAPQDELFHRMEQGYSKKKPTKDGKRRKRGSIEPSNSTDKGTGSSMTPCSAKNFNTRNRRQRHDAESQQQHRLNDNDVAGNAIIGDAIIRQSKPDWSTLCLYIAIVLGILIGIAITVGVVATQSKNEDSLLVVVEDDQDGALLTLTEGATKTAP